jgi:3-(3-hydroxy-phenyl)propionate hydroxylase
VYRGAAHTPLYSFDLLPTKAQKFPAFVNLQQYYTEEFLIDGLANEPLVDLRWQSTATAIAQHSDHVLLEVTTPAGRYQLTADYVVAADGCRSAIREMLNIDFDGQTFEDNFLIADIRMHAPFPSERRFFFDAPFNEGRTALIHRQPDDLWRVDCQLGWDIDREAALKAESVTAKVQAAIGEGIDFEFEWVSLYTFQCRRMRQFVHQRVIFVGDAAHLVSPFGARGANGGIQDVDNLGWKLARVLRGETTCALLDSYDEERGIGADENIANSTRATNFMTPKSPAAKAFQGAVLDLAAEFPFARALINSGRLSVPCSLAGCTLITPDRDRFDTPDVAPGTSAVDAPIAINDRKAWLLNQLGGEFVCLYFAGSAAPPTSAEHLPPGAKLLTVNAPRSSCTDPEGLLHARYDAKPGTTYLFRPDQHVAGRWRTFDPPAIAAAWTRSLALH